MDISSLTLVILGVGFLASELLLGFQRRSAKTEGSQEADDGSLRLLWRVILFAMAAGCALAIFGIGPSLPGSHIFWLVAGTGIFVAGTALRWWAISHLGRFFTVDVALAANHHVVDTGPYRWIRHPSYLGLLLQFLGLACCMNCWLSVLVIVPPIFLALRHRMNVEEIALTKVLGADYTTYAHKHRRLIPIVY